MKRRRTRQRKRTPKSEEKTEGEVSTKKTQEMKGQAEEYVKSSSVWNKEIVIDVNDGTSSAAKRVQTQSKRGMAQERKNGEHQTEKNRKFRESSKFPRSDGKSGLMDVEENKDVVMNENLRGKNKNNSEQNDNTTKKPWSVAPAGRIAAKFFIAMDVDSKPKNGAGKVSIRSQWKKVRSKRRKTKSIR